MELYKSKYSTEGSHHRDSAKNDPEVGRSDLTNSGNLVELLQHRIEGRNKTLTAIFRMPHEIAKIYCFNLDLLLLLFLSYFNGNFNINELWFFYILSIDSKFKITQWQQCPMS